MTNLRDIELHSESALEKHSPAIAAILRGIRPGEVAEIGEALLQAGLSIIEVPLNSPEALASIEKLAASVGDRALIGAGTVLDTRSVDAVAAAGARFAVAPNASPEVISRALDLGIEPMPGFMTPTEAFAALAAGARQLKLFPASSLGFGHIRAVRDVLPVDCRIWAVGGVSAANVSQWVASGAYGVAVGGSLYRPGRSARDVRERVEELVHAWRDADRSREG
jgi:2-dehydro-3-deoxyphosphogalactonate aldolase